MKKFIYVLVAVVAVVALSSCKCKKSAETCNEDAVENCCAEEKPEGCTECPAEAPVETPAETPAE